MLSARHWDGTICLSRFALDTALRLCARAPRLGAAAPISHVRPKRHSGHGHGWYPARRSKRRPRRSDPRATLPPFAEEAAAAVQPLDPPTISDHSLVAPPPPDLFVRLRAGFKPRMPTRPSSIAKLNWYANHPDYLERTWSRAEQYLHYIVEQLSARSIRWSWRCCRWSRAPSNPMPLAGARLGPVAIHPRNRLALRPKQDCGMTAAAMWRLHPRRARLPAGPA